MKKRSCIMVVDNDQGMRGMLNRNLQLEGYGVAMATDGSSALTMLDKRKPDLVILDVMMPELDGFQVLSRIRQRSSVPVIMLTARGEATLLRKTLFTDADDYVRMPFQTGELVARIRAKLRSAGPKVTMPMRDDPHPKNWYRKEARTRTLGLTLSTKVHC